MNTVVEQSYVAHVRNTINQWEIHSLEDHLLAVASLAKSFADSFVAGDWAYFSGLWHDLGKYRPQFQKYIRTVSGYEVDAHIESLPGRVTHSTAGAVHAAKKLGAYGRILGYIISGHHAGLPDWNSDKGGQGSLIYRLNNSDDEYLESISESIPSDILEPKRDVPKAPNLKREEFALWVRMLFSCLVDADFLDTEAFMNYTQSDQRGKFSDLTQLKCRFDDFMKKMAARADATHVNTIRAEVLRLSTEGNRKTNYVF